MVPGACLRASTSQRVCIRSVFSVDVSPLFLARSPCNLYVPLVIEQETIFIPSSGEGGRKRVEPEKSVDEAVSCFMTSGTEKLLGIGQEPRENGP